MRITDWSSDVCSSDLKQRGLECRKRHNAGFTATAGRQPRAQAAQFFHQLVAGTGGRTLIQQVHRQGPGARLEAGVVRRHRSEEHTSELQSLMRISYAVFCLKKKHSIKCYNQCTDAN